MTDVDLAVPSEGQAVVRPGNIYKYSSNNSMEGSPSQPRARWRCHFIIIGSGEDATILSHVPDGGFARENRQGSDAPGKEPQKQLRTLVISDTNQQSLKQETATSRKEHYKRFISENAVPHISSAATKLPPSRYHGNLIAQKTSCIIARVPRFYSNYLETNIQFSEA